MSKILKTFSILPLLVLFIGFLILGYYSKVPEQEVLAQEYGRLTCNGPIIPNGQIAEDVVRLINVVFKEYQFASSYLGTVINYGQNLLAAISQSDDVCDFSRCQPNMANNMPGEVSNVAPDFILELNAYIVKGRVGIRPGICAPGECIGDPCAIGDIRSSVKGMYNLRSTFAASYNIIHNTFEKKSQAVTEDTRIKENDYLRRDKPDGPEPSKVENADPAQGPVDMITKKEDISRRIEAVEGLLELCSLSELEREMIRAGKMGHKTVRKCIDALKDGSYEYPEPWSEACEDLCSAGPTEWCIDCLSKCGGTSILAKLNCRIYGTEDSIEVPENSKNCSNGADDSCCGDECGGGYFDYFSPDCDECLSKGLTGDEKEAWLCGGHLHNWICCSAVPLN